MKTIVTFLIAILAFASTVAWAGEPAPTSGRPAANAEASSATSAQRAARAGTPAASRGVARGAHEAPKAGRTDPAAEFRIELPDAPAVFCACVNQRRLG